MMNKQTVFVVLRTLTLYSPEQDRLVDALPVVDGVFSSYEAANDFVDPLLDGKGPDIEYFIVEREVQ